MFSVSYPGSTLLSVKKLRSSRPAPTRSTSAAAVCTSTRASRPNVRPAPTRPARLMPPTDRELENRSAGASPNAEAVSSVTPAVKISAGKSRLVWSRLGILSGAKPTRIGRTIHARTTAPMPPRPASKIGSVIWARTRPARPAPRAWRTSRSPRRPSARTEKRLATFAHAMRSTIATVPMSSQSGPSTFPTSSSSRVRTIGRCCSMMRAYWGGPP